MADSENVGAIDISITADYSPLLDAFKATEDAAQAAGKDVADAFNAGVSSGQNLAQTITEQLSLIEPAAVTAAGSLDTFESAIASAVASGMTLNEALASVATSVGNVQTAATVAADALESLQQPISDDAQQLNLFGDALNSIPFADTTGQLNLFANELEPVAQQAKQAAQGVQQVGTAAGGMTPPVNDAGLSLSDLVKGLLAFQASLSTLQGFRDFASAALDASDSFKTAQVALSNLTGSAAQANQTIGQLVSLAEQDGLSMPTLLQAATRMQALVGAAAPVPAILAQLANAGAVSGQGIGAAANAFDRIATSGTAAARTLLPLGINLEDLAKSFNALTNTSEATNLNIGALLKTLSETDRVQVLTDALNKLNGTAQQVANETFGGQWNQLVAQWSQVLKSAGDAMAPLLSDLVALGKTDLLPFAQSAAGALKGFTDTVSTVAGTIDGLIGKLKDLAGSIPGAKTAWDSFVEAVGKYNTYSLAKSGIDELALAVQSLFGIVPGATSMTAAMNAELAKLQSTGTAAKQSIDLIGDSIKTLLAADKTTAAQFDIDVKALNQITSSVANHTAVIKGNVAGLQDQWAALEKVNSASKNIPDALSSVSLALANDTMAAQKATLAYQAQAGAYQSTLAAFNTGNATLGAVDAAFAKMTASEQAAAAAGAPVAGSFQAIDQQANAAVNSSKILATNLGIVADQAAAQKDVIDELNASVLVDSQKLDLLVAQEQKVATQVAAGTKQYSEQLLVKAQVTAANQKLTDDTFKLQTAELAEGNAAAGAGGQIGLLQHAQEEANLALDQAKIKFDAAGGSTNNYIAAQKAALGAAVSLAQAAAEQGADMSRSTSSLDLTAVAAAGAAAKLQVLTQAFHDNKTAASEVASAQSAYVSTQVAFASAQAAAQTGLQGTTDAYDLQRIAVAKAQAEVTAYQTLQQQGIDVSSQLQGAMDKLTQEQNKLNGMTVTATSDTDKLIDAQVKLYGAMGSLPAVMGPVSGGLNQIATSATQAASQLEGVAAAIQSVEDDFKALNKGIDGTIGGAGFGGPAGTLVHQTGSNQAGNMNVSFLYPSDVISLAQGLLAQGMSPKNVEQQIELLRATYGGIGPVDLSTGLAPTPDQLKSGNYLGGPNYSSSTSTSTASTSASSASTQAAQSASVLAVAQATLAAADAALNKLEASGTATDAQIAAATALVQTANQAYINAGGFQGGIRISGPIDTSGTNLAGVGTGASSGGVTSTSSSSAINGGVYPDVTAHQAAGEVWQVAVVGTGTGAVAGPTPVSTSGSSSSNTSSAGSSASGTASIVAGAVGTAYQLATLIGNLTGSIAAVADQVAQVAATITKGTPGQIQNVTLNATTVTSGSLPTVQGQGGSGAPTGVINTINNGYLPTAQQLAQDTAIAQAAAAAAGVQWDGSVPWDGKNPNATGTTTTTTGTTPTTPGPSLNAYVAQLAAQLAAADAALTALETSGTATAQQIAQAQALADAANLAYENAAHGNSTAQIATLPSSQGGGGVAPQVTVHVDLTGANFAGLTSGQVQQSLTAAMTQAMTQGLVNTLRAQGARF